MHSISKELGFWFGVGVLFVSSEERKKRDGLEAAVRDTSTQFSGLEV